MNRTPKFALALLVGTVAWSASAVTAWQNTPPQTFRSDVDLLQLDVTVLDAERHPVRGLTARDFTVLVDGKARPIVALTEVTLPSRPSASASWMNEVAADTVSNTISETGRAVILMVDHRWPLPINVFAQRIARAAVEQLGPGDLASLLYTLNIPRVTQGFTNDRARLLNAIDQMPMAAGEGELFAQCYCNVCPHEAIARAADAVRDLHRQKTMIVIGQEITLQSSGSAADPCFGMVKAARERMFAALDRSNVVLHYLDPVGLRTLAPTASGRSAPPPAVLASIVRGEMIRAGNLRTLAARTGGRSIGSNSAELELPGVFAESSSYYLAGIEPPAPRKDGRDVKIEVKVRPQGLQVNARRAYPPTTLSPEPDRDLPAEVPASLWQELAGTWSSAQRPLVVTAAPLGLLPSGKTAVAVVVEGHWSAPAGRAGAPAAKPGMIEVVAGSFDREGKSLATHYQTVQLPDSVSMRPNGNFEILSRLVVDPGAQEVRVALRPAGGTPAGSVYADLQVPNFKKEDVSLSGIVIGSGSGALSASSDLLDTLLPFAPTARRTFTRRDDVSGIIRVFERTDDPAGDVELSTRIVGEDDQPALNQTKTLQASEFGPDHLVEYRFDLPVDTLRPGEYLLTIEAVRGEHRAKRQLRFRVE